MRNTDYHHGSDVEAGRRHRHEWSPGTPLSVAVIEAVAAASGRDPIDIAPLNEYVDPDALDDLFRDRDDRSVGTVSFPLEDYLVVVHGTGEIVVHPPE